MKEQYFTFSWRNLSAWHTEKKQRFWSITKTKKTILHKVQGSVDSYSLVAIMGASGAGKTTLLASLAGKNNENSCFLEKTVIPTVVKNYMPFENEKEGDILLNNKIISDDYVKSISSYVYQDDIVTDSLTVSEYFEFTSALKLDKNKDGRSKVIGDVLRDLNLQSCRRTVLKNLSGGERKRVALGTELLNDPCILFCDEPTSGLDSYSAIAIIKQLERRAKMGKLVLVTIHQPSSQLFDYFGHIILLAWGKVFYQGSRYDLANYFNKLNLHCPVCYNPAEFYIKCMSTKSTQPIEATDVEFTNHAYVGNGKIQNGNVYSGNELTFRNTRKSFWSELYWLVWRASIDTRRNFGYHLLQFLLLMITASILAMSYPLVNSESGDVVQNVKGILFFFTSELIFTHTYAVVNTFPAEQVIFLREKPLYSTHSYFISKIVTITPRNLIQSFLFLLINYVALDILMGFSNFCYAFVILSIACTSGSMIGFCISAVFSSVEYMDLFLAPYEILTMLAAGILLNMKSLDFFSWIKYISPFYYTYESLSVLYWTKVDAIICKNGTVVCYSSGKQVLEELGFYTDEVGIFWDVTYMVLLTIFVGILGFIVIYYKRHKFTSY